MVEMARVEGKDHGKVVLYALSTCVWCRKTKRLLNELGLAYEYVDVDRLELKQRKAVLHELRRWNPSLSYPTLVIDDRRAIVGLKEDEIRKAFDHEG